MKRILSSSYMLALQAPQNSMLCKRAGRDMTSQHCALQIFATMHVDGRQGCDGVLSRAVNMRHSRRAPAVLRAST
jgi:hypothetical protein